MLLDDRARDETGVLAVRADARAGGAAGAVRAEQYLRRPHTLMRQLNEERSMRHRKIRAESQDSGPAPSIR